jgi:nitrite reductase/ring-hydroxylating ferredoxin subunit
MPARHFDFCRRDELLRARHVTRWIDALRDEVTMLLVDDTPIAYSSICPHFGGEFDVRLDRRELQCRWHGWRFDVRSGECLTYPTRCRLRRYPVVEDGDRLQVRHDVQDR